MHNNINDFNEYIETRKQYHALKKELRILTLEVWLTAPDYLKLVDERKAYVAKHTAHLQEKIDNLHTLVQVQWFLLTNTEN